MLEWHQIKFSFLNKWTVIINMKSIRDGWQWEMSGYIFSGRHLLTLSQHIPQNEISNYHRSKKCQLKRHAQWKARYLRLHKNKNHTENMFKQIKNRLEWYFSCTNKESYPGLNNCRSEICDKCKFIIYNWFEGNVVSSFWSNGNKKGRQ